MSLIRAALISVVIVTLLAGCATEQKVQAIDTARLHNICIVKHKEVREGVLAAIQETLDTHQIKSQIVPGSYQLKDNRWMPTYKVNDVSSCDAVLFYVANWRWDISMYMNFAGIWVVTTDSKPIRLGSATYSARASLNKFINAHDKIVELMNQLLGQMPSSLPLHLDTGLNSVKAATHKSK